MSTITLPAYALQMNSVHQRLVKEGRPIDADFFGDLMQLNIETDSSLDQDLLNILFDEGVPYNAHIVASDHTPMNQYTLNRAGMSEPLIIEQQSAMHGIDVSVLEICLQGLIPEGVSFESDLPPIAHCVTPTLAIAEKLTVERNQAWGPLGEASRELMV